MIDKNQARALAEAYLEKDPPEVPFVILDKHTEDHGWCWVFFYNARRYVEDGDASYALAGNGPILVDKRTGEI
jgi:hypothetical protein